MFMRGCEGCEATTASRRRSGFLDRDDFHSLVGTAIQAGVMRELRLVALGAYRETRRGDLLMRPALVPPRSGQLMFWIRHSRSSFRVGGAWFSRRQAIGPDTRRAAGCDFARRPGRAPNSPPDRAGAWGWTE